MDFGRTQISGLLNNITQEKVRYALVFTKLKTLLSLNRGKKLINTSIDKLCYTSSSSEIYKNINFQHPLVLILLEYLKKLEHTADGSSYFLSLLDRLVDSVSFLLENGLSPRQMARSFNDASLALKHDAPPATEENSAGKEIETLSEDVKGFVRRVVSNRKVAELLIEAIETTKSFDEQRIRVFKVPSGALSDSHRLDGFILNRKPEGSVLSLRETSVGIFNCPFDINRTELKGTVLFKNHQELLSFSKEEAEQAKRVVDSLNVNVVVVSGNIDEMFLEFANQRNILVLRVFNKFDLRRICDAVGGVISSKLGPLEHKGWIKEVSFFKEANMETTRIIAGDNVSTIVLRHTLKPVLDEAEREILSCLEALKRAGSLSFVSDNFHKELAGLVGKGDIVREQICKAFEETKPVKIIQSDGYRCARYALEMIGLLLDVDDFLLSKRDVMDVKPPNSDRHWDEDH